MRKKITKAYADTRLKELWDIVRWNKEDLANMIMSANDTQNTKNHIIAAEREIEILIPILNK